MPGPHGLRLISFPSADENFREEVQSAVKRLPDRQSEDEWRRQLVDELRQWYPAVEIVPQDTLAQLELQRIRVWYVYRDGRVRPIDDRRERLYAALASARRTFDASREIIDDARTVARAAGHERVTPAEPELAE
jgi:hypothetical protein